MDYNNDFSPQQTPNYTAPPATDYCPYCGTSRVGGVCPACGNSATGRTRATASTAGGNPHTAGKAILAIFLVLLASGVVGVFSLMNVGKRAIDNGSTYDYGYDDGPDYSYDIPAPMDDPDSNGATDAGFYWNDWAPYLYGYDNAPPVDFGTIYDARQQSLDYTVSDFKFIYDGYQQVNSGLGGNRATPAGDGYWVSYEAHYVQLSGDNPHIATINDQIRSLALDGVYYIISPNDSMHTYMQENSYDSFYTKTDTYVTYMTEDYLSVAIIEWDMLGDFEYYYLYTLNFDMKTGELIELYDVLTPDDAFMTQFDQLGSVQMADVDGFTAYSSSERRSMLDGSLADPILILQPNGVQIGYIFDLYDKDIDNNGWLTVEYTLDETPEAIRTKFYG